MPCQAYECYIWIDPFSGNLTEEFEQTREKRLILRVPELNEEWQNVQNVHPTLNQMAMISKN